MSVLSSRTCRNVLANIGILWDDSRRPPAVASPACGTIRFTIAAESALHSCASSRAFMAFPPASARATAGPVPGGRRRERPNVLRQSRPAAGARKRWSTGPAMIWRVPARPQNRPAPRSSGGPTSEARTRGRAGGETGASPGKFGPHRLERVQSTAHAKETKRGGKGGRKSQCLDSTEESGELDPQEPGGWEARHRVTTPLARNTWEALNSRLVCHRNASG
jgi:hypothetical protein